MNYLLEFHQFDDLSELQIIIKDLISSEIDESLDVKVLKSIIDTDFNIKTKKSNQFEFDCYLVSIKNIIIDSELYKNILLRLEKILNIEFDDEFKCLKLLRKTTSGENASICIMSKNDFFKIKSIYDFESNIEESIWDIPNNEYSPVININTDQKTSWENGIYNTISIWLRELDNKIGIEISLIKKDIESNFVEYSINAKAVFNEYNIASSTYSKEINLENVPLRIRAFIDRKSKNYSFFKELKKYCDIINSYTFKLDIDEFTEKESERFVNFIRNKILTHFSNEITSNLSRLYSEFEKLKEYNIEVNWTNQGNYFFILDINYKGNLYLLNVDFKNRENQSDKIKIEFKDLGIKDTIPIEYFSETVYLYLEEN
jgi:hypothetical protein